MPPGATEEVVQKLSESLRKIAPFTMAGGMIAGCMTVGSLGGYWLDEQLDTGPWLLLVGSVLGIVSGFYHFFKIVLNLDAKRKRQDDG